MTTTADPTTLRTALEALVKKWSDEAISAMSNGLMEQAVATEWCASDLRAVLATPAPAADEARCGFAGCGGVRDDVYHEPCLTGGVFHDHKACHPFHPAPTPAPPTPPATERCRPDECGATSPFFKPGWHCRLTMGHAPGHDVHTPPATEERVTHGRHCRCTPCRREDWTNPNLAHCGMHGPSCPPVYAPIDLTPPATEPVAALVEEMVNDWADFEFTPAVTGRDDIEDWAPVIRARLDAIVAAARAEGLDGLTVAMVADAIHPEGQGPTIDCCMGSTVESLYPPDEAARLHRKHHEEAATRFLAYLAARARRAGEELG